MRSYRFSTRLIACVLVLVFAFSGMAASKTSKIYDNAIDKMSEGAYAEAAELFDSISSYEDASTLGMYCKAIAMAQDGYYEDAINAFEFFGDYKDCKFLKVYYSAKLIEEQAEADPLLYLDAADMFETIRLYKDSSVQAKNCRQELYDVAANIVDNLKDPILDKEAIINGYEQVLTAEDYLLQLEPYMDIQSKLEDTYFVLGKYCFYGTELEEAEEYFLKSGEDNQNSKEWIERCRKFSDLKWSIKAAVCDSDKKPLLELQSPYELFVDDVEENQLFKISLEIMNEGEDSYIETGLRFIDQEEQWSWEKRTFKSGKTKSFQFNSAEQDFVDEFKIGKHTCIWLLDDFPFVWYEYEIKEGVSPDKQAIKKLVDSLEYEFYITQFNMKEKETFSMKSSGDTLNLSQLKYGYCFTPVFKVKNTMDRDIEYSLYEDINGYLISYESELLKKEDYNAYADFELMDTPGDYTFKYYFSSCLVGEFHATVVEEPKPTNKLESIIKEHRVQLMRFRKMFEDDLIKMQEERETTEKELNDVSKDNTVLIEQLKEKYINVNKAKLAQEAGLIEELDLLLGNRGYEYTEDGNVVYTVTRGETLAIICTKLGLDYEECRDRILEINGLDAEYQILVGQILTIPVVDYKGSESEEDGYDIEITEYKKAESEEDGYDIEIKEYKKVYRADFLKLRTVLRADFDKRQTDYESFIEEVKSISVDDAVLIANLKDKYINGIKENIILDASLIEEINLLLGYRGYEHNKNGDVLYTVTRGDTLAIICKKCGVDYWEYRDRILEINEIESDADIRVGQVLLIPGWFL